MRNSMDTIEKIKKLIKGKGTIKNYSSHSLYVVEEKGVRFIY
jgi:hypothetical protein